ncbi:hypothetical protein [Brevibacillus migulae]|uniref:hypothetical protein n=1 Tax=Brevibacillus migulae TaxID=1644114 RepID=UPI00106EF018|nr:hypothetical protein [Brevibacillus migulae]
MSGRNLVGIIVTGGVIAGIGYMMLPRRRKGSMRAVRMLLAGRTWGRWGRQMMKSATRLVPAVMK